MESPFTELDELLLQWEDGALDSAGIQRVREILRGDEAARKHCVQMRLLSAALRLEDEAGIGVSVAVEHSARRESDATSASIAERASSRRSNNSPEHANSQAFGDRVRGLGIGSKSIYWFAAIAASLALVLSGRVAFLELDRQVSQAPSTSQPPYNRDSSGEATSAGIALVTRVVDVTWSDGQEPLDVGDALVPGRLALESGYMQVEFFCGATVILEGPAELDLQSPMLARVHRGRLRAQVPPAARGFSIDVADMKVVDLGTEFGLSVTSEGADIQVFDGEVELQQPSQQRRLLTAGQAVVRSISGDYQDVEVSPESYVDIASLDSRDVVQQTERYQRWATWSDSLRRDPRLIAYYAFDSQDAWQRKLQSSLDSDDGELDGAIVGARRVRGRWPAKGALEFKRPGDRVRIQIPGEFGSLSLACWARIDSLDRWYNSLFLTDNYNQGEPHWQILDSGQLFFSVRAKSDADPHGRTPSGPTHQAVLSPPFWKPAMSGKWMHLATTYDVSSGLVIHYLNGELLHTETIPKSLVATTTRVGPASIGNWSLPTKPDAKFAVRNLNGSIDEFIMFSAALTAEEIRDIYVNGRP